MCLIYCEWASSIIEFIKCVVSNDSKGILICFIPLSLKATMRESGLIKFTRLG